jgi:hypothetical protein
MSSTKSNNLNTKIVCPCGSVFNRSHLRQHLKTEKHQFYVGVETFLANKRLYTKEEWKMVWREFV